MAKHNLLLGSAVASIGDVTMMRRTGKQVSRVRVRTIANPKTEGQAFQRAAMANITKFYAPLAGVLEKSWEGKNKAASYSAFIKKNVDLARQNNYLSKKGVDFMPMPYYLSMGTLPPIMAEVDDTNNGIWIDDFGWSDNTLGAFSQSMLAYSPDAKNGDQITLLAFVKNDDGYTPVWCRFYLDTTSSAVIDTVLTGFHAYNSATQGQTPVYSFQVNNPGDGIVAAAMIHSRWENGKWRRSPERLDCIADIDDLFSNQNYLDECIASFRASETANPSEVYLNGNENFPNTLHKTGTLDAADSLPASNLKRGFVRGAGAFVPYVEDETGKKWAFRNNIDGNMYNGRIAASNHPVAASTIPEGWGFLPFTNSTDAAVAGYKANYDFLVASGVPANELGL